MLSKTVAFANLAIKDVLGIKSRRAAPDAHLAAAEAWLVRAHEAGADGGVSYGYSARGGWRTSYPETSGYIASTFFRLARRHGGDAQHAGSAQDYCERALRIVRWLMSVQNADGSFANPRYRSDGIIFDTGQDLFGLVRAYEVTGQPDILAAARRAAGWLVRVADADGRWTRFEHLYTPHVYNTRTAWALLRLNQADPQAVTGAQCGEQGAPAREHIARSNLGWALAEQQRSGFFNHCAFVPGQAPFTHTIAYTVEGLIESGLLLHDDRYVAAAIRCVDAVLAHICDDGFLPGRIAVDGRAAASFCCLTGNCQFALCCARLFAHTADERYKITATRLLDYVMAHQDIATSNADIRGAIKGSHPIWGGYAPLTFPNWAAKFFIDAMWLRKEWGL